MPLNFCYSEKDGWETWASLVGGMRGGHRAAFPGLPRKEAEMAANSEMAKAADTVGHPRELLREKLPQLDKNSINSRSEWENIRDSRGWETHLKCTWSPKFLADIEQEHHYPSVAESHGPKVSALWESLCHSSEAAAETSATHSDEPECRMSHWHNKSSWQQGTWWIEEIFSAFL